MGGLPEAAHGTAARRRTQSRADAWATWWYGHGPGRTNPLTLGEKGCVEARSADGGGGGHGRLSGRHRCLAVPEGRRRCSEADMARIGHHLVHVQQC
jgi:hypothetical protein